MGVELRGLAEQRAADAASVAGAASSVSAFDNINIEDEAHNLLSSYHRPCDKLAESVALLEEVCSCITVKYMVLTFSYF